MDRSIQLLVQNPSNKNPFRLKRKGPCTVDLINGYFLHVQPVPMEQLGLHTLRPQVQPCFAAGFCTCVLPAIKTVPVNNPADSNAIPILDLILFCFK